MDFKTIFIILVIVTLVSGAFKAKKFLKNKENIWVFKDPLYLIVMVVGVIITIGLGFLSLPLIGFGIAFILLSHQFLIRISSGKYDLEKDVKKTMRIMKKCPQCYKELPSYLTAKCPYCTADLN